MGSTKQKPTTKTTTTKKQIEEKTKNQQAKYPMK